MKGEGGGWMAFQRRYDGSVEFHTKNWNDYKNGFGDGYGEYWLGNDLLNEITTSGNYDLFVVAEKFNGEQQTKRFSGFSIASEVENYRLTYTSVLSNYSSHDLFLKMQNQMFSTPGRDNDAKVDSSCADLYPGGWWYNACHSDFMNGQYFPSQRCPRAKGLHWKTWSGDNHRKCLRKTLLLIKERPTM